MALVYAAPSHAQSLDPRRARTVPLQLFLPSASTGSTFTIERTSVPRHLGYELGLALGYSVEPLIRGDESEIVDGLFQGELLAALGLFNTLELGLAVPVVATSSGDGAEGDFADLRGRTSLGDVRLSIKAPILRGDFSLAARGVVTLPFASAMIDASQAHVNGERAWTLMPELLAAHRFDRLLLAGSIAYRLRRDTGTRILGEEGFAALEQDDELDVGLGASYLLTSSLSVVGEMRVRAGIGGRSHDCFDVGDSPSLALLCANEVPVSADLGVRVRAGDAVVVEGGVGRGFGNGYGTAPLHAFVIARFVSDAEDCPAGPEDFDGFEDGDFCRDLDNDADGLRDESDVCPNDAEDRDGFADDDGCPDTDNDADGVVDGGDRCPIESEDRDGNRDDDGCPEADNDEDGIADGLDSCPDDPEDRDQFQDDDGCPEPGPQRATVTVTDTRILISERIYFDFDLDTIRAVSLPLLDQVAEVVRELPGRPRIRVEGYTDDVGNASYNLDLSYRRARAVVEYLSTHGVPREQLEYEGYGNQRPVAANDTPEGRAFNRRVEFVILGAATPPPPPPRRPQRQR